MKNLSKYLLLAIAISFTGCFEREEFSDIPNIGFEEIRFVDTDAADSLILSFSFEDEAADIGLSNALADLYPPYHLYDIIIDSSDSLVTIGQDTSTLNLPLYKAPLLFVEEIDGEVTFVGLPSQKVLFSEMDNRPSYSCEAYEIVQSDTFFIQRNEFHFNFYVAFEEKVGEEYREVDFREIFDSQDCSLGNFNGRIPFFDRDGKSGVLTYAMLSQGFIFAFQDRTIRLRFFIYDRALNKSNEVVSPDFRLADITQ